MMARASSGSRSSINSIEPLMSANSAVTVLRSPSSDADEATGAIRIAVSAAGCGLGAAAVVDVVNDAPHSPQNFSPGWLEAPHLEQATLSGSPQFAQNLRPSRLSLSHFEQRILFAQLVQQRLSFLQIGGVEAFGEPVVDLGEHRAGLVATALFCEQPRQAHRRTQLKRFCALQARDFDCITKASSSFFYRTFVANQ